MGILFTDKWTSSEYKSNAENAFQFMTTSYALDLKVPMLNWLKCSDFELVWSDPSQAGNNNNGGNNPPNNNGGNNNGGNPPNNNGNNPPNNNGVIHPNNNNGGNPTQQ